jgi:hypothetical protein
MDKDLQKHIDNLNEINEFLDKLTLIEDPSQIDLDKLSKDITFLTSKLEKEYNVKSDSSKTNS